MNDKFYNGLKYPIRGKIFEREEVVDIHTFAINSLKDNIFSASNNNMYSIDDFIYFILPKDIFKYIYEQAYNNGLEDGKKQNIKKKYKINNINS